MKKLLVSALAVLTVCAMTVSVSAARIPHGLAEDGRALPAESSESISGKAADGLNTGRSGEDAEGLDISEKMRGQIRGTYNASTASEDGIEMADGTDEEREAEIRELLEKLKGAPDEELEEIINEIEKLHAEDLAPKFVIEYDSEIMLFRIL